MKQKLLSACCIIAILGLTLVTPAGASVPSEARSGKLWGGFIRALIAQEAPFGAMAASARALLFFQDVETREVSYWGLIQANQLGHPSIISPYFLTADLDPEGQDFAFDYFFLKGLVHSEKNSKKWANFYFSKTNVEQSDLNALHDALKAYQGGDLPKAEELIRKLLSKHQSDKNGIFAQNLSRLLARVYFDGKKYEDSLEIYLSFLLKRPSIQPSDWMEAAWNLFYLKRYDQALGYLYNLQAGGPSEAIYLEAYILKGLIYDALCRRESVSALIASFDKGFRDALNGIRTGEPLEHFAALKRIRDLRPNEYQEVRLILNSLRFELKNIVPKLDPSYTKVAQYLYSTEISNQQRRLRLIEPEALKKAAENLFIARESLRFLEFEIRKLGVDPTKVFAQAKPKKMPIGNEEEKNGSASKMMRWPQIGDFWRDERGKYLAQVISLCEEL